MNSVLCRLVRLFHTLSAATCSKKDSERWPDSLSLRLATKGLRRTGLRLLPWGCALSLAAAERVFDFSELKSGSIPPGWKAFVAGTATASADWQVIFDEVPSAFSPLTPNATQTARRGVVAQLSRDPADERFPVLAFEGERYGNFNATLRFKLVDGQVEQMAGLAFRISDPKNFYVVRASSLGHNVRFYKFVEGQRSSPLGPELPIEKGRWYELGIKAEANRLQILLDGKEIMPELTDNSHISGQIGLFTKSDSVSYFSDLRLTYKPLESLAASLARTLLEKQPRLLDVEILGKEVGNSELHVMGAKNSKSLGRLANDVEKMVFTKDRANYHRTMVAGVVIQPLHDRNGEVIGVAQFTLKPYPGQLEDAMITKTIPWVKEMDLRIGASKDLSE